MSRRENESSETMLKILHRKNYDRSAFRRKRWMLSPTRFIKRYNSSKNTWQEVNPPKNLVSIFFRLLESLSLNGTSTFYATADLLLYDGTQKSLILPDQDRTSGQSFYVLLKKHNDSWSETEAAHESCRLGKRCDEKHAWHPIHVCKGLWPIHVCKGLWPIHVCIGLWPIHLSIGLWSNVDAKNVAKEKNQSKRKVSIEKWLVSSWTSEDAWQVGERTGAGQAGGRAATVLVGGGPKFAFSLRNAGRCDVINLAVIVAAVERKLGTRSAAMQGGGRRGPLRHLRVWDCWKINGKTEVEGKTGDSAVQSAQSNQSINQTINGSIELFRSIKQSIDQSNFFDQSNNQSINRTFSINQSINPTNKSAHTGSIFVKWNDVLDGGGMV